MNSCLVTPESDCVHSCGIKCSNIHPTASYTHFKCLNCCFILFIYFLLAVSAWIGWFKSPPSSWPLAVFE